MSHANILDQNLDHERMADRILYALELAIEQKDLEIADGLKSALELAMTRNTGGGEFVERRDYPERIQQALDKLKAIKS